MKETNFGNQDYAVIDSGNLRKLEKLGEYHIIRPALNAYWEPSLSNSSWEKADGVFQRNSSGGGKWTWRRSVPSSWNVKYNNLYFKVKPTDFGHIGLFPEQKDNWNWLKKVISSQQKIRTLNLFAYSGGSSLAMAEAGADVCHVDAAKGMVDWARDNLSLNKHITQGIRWIVDDVHKFLSREIKRGSFYSGIVLDPPSFGRGPSGQVWKIENDLIPLLQKCRTVMGNNPRFILLSMHSDGFSLASLERILKGVFGSGSHISAGEMTIDEQSGSKISAGIYARWECNK